MLHHILSQGRLGLNAFPFWDVPELARIYTSSSTCTGSGLVGLRISFMRVYHSLLALAEFVDILFQLEPGGSFLRGKRSH